MTTAVVSPAPTTTLRPVPWHRLAWVAWRRYRTTLLALLALLCAVALLLIVRGHQMRDAYAAVQACTPQRSAACGYTYSVFHDTYGNAGPAAALFVWLPAIIGAFAGAPLLARELETGTFRYAWTQGAGRTRWMVSLTTAGILGVLTLAAAFGLLLTWYQQPLFDAGIQQRLHASVFPVTGIAVVGWALLAFALGVFLGLLTRRVLPALALTLATWTGLGFLGSALRGRYQAPLVTSNLQLGTTDFPVDQWWTKGGARVTDVQINQVLQSAGAPTLNGGNVQAAPGNNSVDPVQYLVTLGFTQLTSYQPDNRYWPFQWIEFGWLTILSALLLGASIWLLRRRPA
jgi:hypothetical protein